MASAARVNITSPILETFLIAADASKLHYFASPRMRSPWRRLTAAEQGRMLVRQVLVAAAVPDKLSDKVEESIKNAQETCADNPVSGECAAAWDEVEELSAAVGHARDKTNETDPLEKYCKENPETDECRTYDN